MPASDRLQKRTQAERIYARFGSVRALHDALKAAGCPRHMVSIYRWNMPRAKGGSAGTVPTEALKYIEKAARHEGVLLMPEDYRPGVL